jgi:predicted  nucleic acid-binding Zn-ribbon protein
VERIVLPGNPAPVDPQARVGLYDRLGSGSAGGTAFVESALQPGGMLGSMRSAELDTEQSGAYATAMEGGRSGRVRVSPITPLLTADEANEQYGIKGALKFDTPTREGAAKLLNGWTTERLKREDILRRADQSLSSGATRLGAALLAQALDPINIGASFIPVVGEARYAALAVRFGKLGGRLLKGAAEGAVGNAVVEPLALLQASSQHLDYTAYDAIKNILFGAGLGAGVHGVFGRRINPEEIVPAPTTKAAAALDETAPKMVFESERRSRLMSSSSIVNSKQIDFREAVFRSALDDMAEGRPVDVGEMLHAQRAQSVEHMARQLDPAAFAERDRLTGHRDSYRRWVGELGDQRTGDPRIAAIDTEIEATRAKLDGAPNRRKAKIYQQRIDELKAQRLSLTDALTAGDTPDMARVRTALQETDFKLRDMAPRISAALREADSRIPGGESHEFGMWDPANPLDESFGAPVERAPDQSPLDDVIRESVRNTLRRKAAPHIDPEAKATIAAVNEQVKLNDTPASVSVLETDIAEAEKAAADAELQVKALRDLGKLDAGDEAAMLAADEAVKKAEQVGKLRGMAARCIIGSGG